jgi:hypothetical protein
MFFDKMLLTMEPLQVNAVQEYEYFESILFLYHICSSFSAPSGKIKPSLCIITNTTATAEAASNKENILSCPSPFRNVLNPNGLIAKIIKLTKIEVSIVISLNNLRLSCEAQSAEGELLAANIKH